MKPYVFGALFGVACVLTISAIEHFVPGQARAFVATLAGFLIGFVGHEVFSEGDDGSPTD